MRRLSVVTVVVASWLVVGCGPSDQSASTSRPEAAPSSTPPASTTRSEVGTREEGVVKWFSDLKGFGVITRPDGSDIIFRSAVVVGGGSPRPGDRVEYGLGGRGPKAVEVIEVVVLPG